MADSPQLAAIKRTADLRPHKGWRRQGRCLPAHRAGSCLNSLSHRVLVSKRCCQLTRGEGVGFAASYLTIRHPQASKTGNLTTGQHIVTVEGSTEQSHQGDRGGRWSGEPGWFRP